MNTDAAAEIPGGISPDTATEARGASVVVVVATVDVVEEDVVVDEDVDVGSAGAAGSSLAVPVQADSTRAVAVTAARERARDHIGLKGSGCAANDHLSANRSE